MIGKQLANILTRCSSHPQGESEGRCQTCTYLYYTHSRIHVTRGWGVEGETSASCFPIIKLYAENLVFQDLTGMVSIIVDTL